MRKLLLAVLCVICVFAISGIAHAAPLTIPSVPVMVIDSQYDSDTTVTLAYTNNVAGFDFGYLDNTSSFVMLGAESTWNGGDVIDFAIRRQGTTEVYSLGEENGVNYATLGFMQDIPASASANPVVTSDYWDTLNIRWGTPSSIVGVSPFAGDVAVTRGGTGDGLAPVPEPATMALLGMGILGLVGLKRKA